MKEILGKISGTTQGHTITKTVISMMASGRTTIESVEESCILRMGLS